MFRSSTSSFNILPRTLALYAPDTTYIGHTTYYIHIKYAYERIVHHITYIYGQHHKPQPTTHKHFDFDRVRLPSFLENLKSSLEWWRRCCRLRGTEMLSIHISIEFSAIIKFQRRWRRDPSTPPLILLPTFKDEGRFRFNMIWVLQALYCLG